MGTNASELGRTLKQLRELGRLEKVDAARKQILRSMARALDDNPQNAALWREYRTALKELMADDSGSAINEALAGLFGDVRDTPKA